MTHSQQKMMLKKLHMTMMMMINSNILNTINVCMIVKFAAPYKNYIIPKKTQKTKKQYKKTQKILTASADHITESPTRFLQFHHSHEIFQRVAKKKHHHYHHHHHYHCRNINPNEWSLYAII